MTEDHDESITNALNAHGIFFKKAVRGELEKLGVTVLGEEYHVSGAERGAIDLLAEVKLGGGRAVLVVECKRAYTAKRKWVFLRSPDQSTKLAYRFSADSPSPTPLFASDYRGFADLTCVEGVEVNLDKPGQPFRVGSPDRIWEAASQCCDQLLGYVCQEMDERGRPDATAKQRATYVLPLMVTNAPIHVCETLPGKVDLASGNHLGAIELQPCERLVLAHPYPASPELAWRRLGAGYLLPAARAHCLKEGIIVVNSGGLAALVDLIRRLPM